MNILKRSINKLIVISTQDRINFIKTILINFMLLPFSQAIKFPILIYGSCKIASIRGSIKLKGNIKKGMVKIGVSCSRSYFSKSYININGVLEADTSLILRRGVDINIYRGASIEFSRNVFISDNCTFFAAKRISIGESTIFGNNCVVMDNDFHYIINTETGIIKNNIEEICIGDNNWITGFCTIKKGTKTPKGTIIAGPNSMVSKNYIDKIPEYSIIAGSPAKLLTSGVRCVANFCSEKEVIKHFKNDVDNFRLVDLDDIENFCTNK